MTDIERLLIQNLHRATCPDPVEVGEYYMGHLPVERGRQVQAHLAQCPYCHNELSLLKNYLNLLQADVDYSLGERISIWIARLLPPAVGLQPAFAVRGEAAGGPLRYEFGERSRKGEINLESQEDLETPGRKMLVGLIVGVPTQKLAAALWQSGGVVAQSEVDEFGNLAMANLVGGNYELILAGDRFEIHIYDLMV